MSVICLQSIIIVRLETFCDDDDGCGHDDVRSFKPAAGFQNIEVRKSLYRRSWFGAGSQ